MSFVYVGAGIFLLLGNNIFNFSVLQKVIFGSLLIIYGLFRLYNSFKKKRESKSEDEEI
jgi:uncharacterized membrane protein HdeD (DUF308 family)